VISQIKSYRSELPCKLIKLRFPVSFGKHYATPLLNERQRGAKRHSRFAPRSLSSNPVALVFPSHPFNLYIISFYDLG